MGAMDDVYGGMDPYDNGGPFMNQAVVGLSSSPLGFSKDMTAPNINGDTALTIEQQERLF